MLTEPALAPVQSASARIVKPARSTTTRRHFGQQRILGRVTGSDVTDVYVIQTLGVADGLGAFQRRQGSGRKVLQQVLGMEARKMQRDVRGRVPLKIQRASPRNSSSESFKVGTTR
jgi:hypothetical protein